MKKLAIITLALLSIAELCRTGSASALFLTAVIAQLVYGRQLYKFWYRLITKGHGGAD